jgi:hypothetical protein
MIGTGPPIEIVVGAPGGFTPNFGGLVDLGTSGVPYGSGSIPGHPDWDDEEEEDDSVPANLPGDQTLGEFVGGIIQALGQEEEVRPGDETESPSPGGLQWALEEAGLLDDTVAGYDDCDPPSSAYPPIFMFCDENYGCFRLRNCQRGSGEYSLVCESMPPDACVS